MLQLRSEKNKGRGDAVPVPKGSRKRQTPADALAALEVRPQPLFS
jgi:hypothetical protein